MGQSYFLRKFRTLAVLEVGKIVLGGTKEMTQEVFPVNSQAHKDIKYSGRFDGLVGELQCFLT